MEDRGQETCGRGSARSAERDAGPGASSSKLRQAAAEGEDRGGTAAEKPFAKSSGITAAAVQPSVVRAAARALPGCQDVLFSALCS